MKRKLYITAGHTIVNGVGTGVKVNGHDEALEVRKIVTDIALYLKHYHNIDVITDKDGWSLNGVANWLTSIVRPDDILIDFHFNAFHTPEAHGTEAFVPEKYSTAEYALARDLVDAVADVTGIKRRKPPVKRESQSQHHRLAMLSRPWKATNVLMEVCFMSCPDDMIRYKSNYHVLISELAETIRSHYEG